MTTATSGRETFDMGRVVTRTFGSISRNGSTFLILAVILLGVPTLLLGWLQMSLNPFPPARGLPSAFSGLWFLSILISLIRWICFVLLQGAIVQGVVADLNGRRATLNECFSTGLRFALPIIGVGILFGIGVGLGFIVLIVPGLILATMWSVAVPVVVVEKREMFNAFGRSRALTKGSRWGIFGLAFAFWLAALAFSFAMLAAFRVMPFGNPGAVAVAARSLPLQLAGAVIGILEGVVSTAGVAVIYYELRSIRDGVAPTALAAVFD